MGEEIRRARTVRVRLDNDEYEVLRWLCEERGIATPAELIRALIAETAEQRESHDNAEAFRQLEDNIERLHWWLIGKTAPSEVDGR